MSSQVWNWSARLCALAMSVAWASAAHATGVQSPEAEDAATAAGVEGQARQVESALRARGYEVARGATKLFTIADCKYTISVLGNCLGNNPAAPYIIMAVPLWSNEYVDNTLRNLLGPLPDKTWATHRFDKRDSLIVVGRMPPPSKYFGFQTYVFTREGQINKSDPIYRTVTAPFLHAILFD